MNNLPKVVIGCFHDPANAQLHYNIWQQTSSKLPALARIFGIHLLEVCWTFAGSCKHAITGFVQQLC